MILSGMFMVKERRKINWLLESLACMRTLLFVRKKRHRISRGINKKRGDSDKMEERECSEQWKRKLGRSVLLHIYVVFECLTRDCIVRENMFWAEMLGDPLHPFSL